MKNMTLRRIAQACGGILHAKKGEEDREISSLVTDSRQAKEGSLFAAIKGERVDGHGLSRQYLSRALSASFPNRNWEKIRQAAG